MCLCMTCNCHCRCVDSAAGSCRIAEPSPTGEQEHRRKLSQRRLLRCKLRTRSRRTLHLEGEKPTLCTRGFSSLVASTAALIATGWSEPVPGGYTPAVDQRLHGAPGLLVIRPQSDGSLRWPVPLR